MALIMRGGKPAACEAKKKGVGEVLADAPFVNVSRRSSRVIALARCL